MIRLYEYEKRQRIDSEGKVETFEQYREFPVFLFTYPHKYNFTWDWAADKLIIDGIAYRISSLNGNTDKPIQVTCICTCDGNGNGGDGNTEKPEPVSDALFHNGYMISDDYLYDDAHLLTP